MPVLEDISQADINHCDLSTCEICHEPWDMVDDDGDLIKYCDVCQEGTLDWEGVYNCVMPYYYTLDKFDCTDQFGVITREIKCVDKDGNYVDVSKCDTFLAQAIAGGQ